LCLTRAPHARCPPCCQRRLETLRQVFALQRPFWPSLGGEEAAPRSAGSPSPSASGPSTECSGAGGAGGGSSGDDGSATIGGGGSPSPPSAIAGGGSPHLTDEESAAAHRAKVTPEVV
jgi:hypothetical protein